MRKAKAKAKPSCNNLVNMISAFHLRARILYMCRVRERWYTIVSFLMITMISYGFPFLSRSHRCTYTSKLRSRFSHVVRIAVVVHHFIFVPFYTLSFKLYWAFLPEALKLFTVQYIGRQRAEIKIIIFTISKNEYTEKRIYLIFTKNRERGSKMGWNCV